MIQRCLKNRKRERPTIQQVMGWLEEARAEVEDGEYDMNKLSLAQQLQSKNLHIQQQQQENHSLREQNDALKEQNDGQKVQSKSLEEQIQLVNPAVRIQYVKFFFHFYFSFFFFISSRSLLPPVMLHNT